MKREYKTGQFVIYVDSFGNKHDALITQWWYGPDTIEGYLSQYGDPGCNVVYVDEDELKRDTYGRQIARETSVVHRSKQPANGCFYIWPDEL